MADEYPNSAGHRGIDTSIAGADHINSDLSRLQRMVREVVAAAGEHGVTGDEIAERLSWDKFRVRPRTSELRQQRRIIDSGKRRKSLAGISSIVWCLPEHEAAPPTPDVTGAAA